MRCERSKALPGGKTRQRLRFAIRLFYLHPRIGNFFLNRLQIRLPQDPAHHLGKKLLNGTFLRRAHFRHAHHMRLGKFRVCGNEVLAAFAAQNPFRVNTVFFIEFYAPFGGDGLAALGVGNGRLPDLKKIGKLDLGFAPGGLKDAQTRWYWASKAEETTCCDMAALRRSGLGNRRKGHHYRWRAMPGANNRHCNGGVIPRKGVVFLTLPAGYATKESPTSECKIATPWVSHGPQ